ncbi:MAG: RsmE family RNA methyltransferase [Acidobacteriota bacterium]
MKASPWLLAEQGSLVAGQIIQLDGNEARHAAGALRLRPGDGVTLIDGSGCMAEAVLRELAKGRASAEVLSVREEAPPEGEGVTLALAVLHGRGMDWAVEKSVEVGVKRFIPVVGERTQAGRKAALDRAPHWGRIALQALKQCKRTWAMEVAEPLTPGEVAEIFGAQRGGVVADRHGVSVTELPASARRFLLVGPEGGFAPSEMNLFADLGWPRLRLGPHVLRSETAAVVGAAVLVANDVG